MGLATVLLVIDMAQNAETPCLSGDQMGNIYYMSPLLHYIFGVANPAKDFMDAYIWEEGLANRGPDNIVSCVYLDLLRNGIVREDDPPPSTPLKHLALAADNCSGQNKNKTMIKFCAWLVESGWVKKVTLLFLIKGHTKQDADGGPRN